MDFLRSNTAVIVAVGPFKDKTDGVTLEIALTITNERITLIAETNAGSAPTIILDNVTGATSGTANDLNYITGQDNAMMQMELAAADVNRVGRAKLTITDAANHVPVVHDYFILPQAIFDWITGVIVPLPANVTQLLGTAWQTPVVAGTPDVNTKLISGDSAAADNLEAEYDGTGYKSYLRRFTAQAGGTSSITLDAGASAVDNFYKGIGVAVLFGTGAGQFRLIADGYVGATKVAPVNRAWITNPSSDSVCVLAPFDLAGLLAEIVANVATAAELVQEIDDTSTKLQDIRDSSGTTNNRLKALVFQEPAPIGPTGNDSEHLHLENLLYADGDINNLILTIEDSDTGLIHSRWIEGFSTSGDLATVAILPFTPEGLVDIYWITSIRRDVTVPALGSAGDGLTAITNRLSQLVTKTCTVLTDGGNSATQVKTDLTAAATNHYKDSIFKITTGSLIEQQKKCTGSTGTTDVVLLFASGFTGTPANGVVLELVND